jgi:branched-subunit amino acid transport protein
VNRIWLSILAVTLANWLLKASAPLLLGNRTLPPVAREIVGLVAPVLLSALIVVELAGPDWQGLDVRQLAGVGVAGAAWALRAPLLMAVLLGTLATAGLRAV